MNSWYCVGKWLLDIVLTPLNVVHDWRDFCELFYYFTNYCPVASFKGRSYFHGSLSFTIIKTAVYNTQAIQTDSNVHSLSPYNKETSLNHWYATIPIIQAKNNKSAHPLSRNFFMSIKPIIFGLEKHQSKPEQEWDEHNNPHPGMIVIHQTHRYS